MNAQYRLKEDWKPVGKSSTAKKLADWMNAMAKQLNRAEVVSGGTARPTDLGFRIEVDSFVNFPFKLTHDSTSIRVEQGNWTRNGDVLALTPDPSETYKSITALDDSSPFGSATYIVYLALESAGTDPALSPVTLSVYAGTALPADNTPVTGNKYCQIGTATAAAGVITAVDQDWWGGDKDDTAHVPDSNSNYDAAGAKRYYSIELSPRAGRHGQTLQDYGWDNPDIDVPVWTDDLLSFRQVVDQGLATEYYIKKYCTIDQALENVNWSYDPGGGAIGDAIIDYIDGQGAYWDLGGEYNGAAGDVAYGRSVGRGTSSGNRAMDLSNSLLYDNSDSTTNLKSLDWDSRILYNDNATPAAVLQWTESGYHLTFDANNIWNATKLTAGNGTYQASIGDFGSDLAGSFLSDVRSALLSTSEYSGFFLYDSYYAWFGGLDYAEGGISAATFKNEGSTAVDFCTYDDRAIDVVVGDYYHLGKQGGTGSDSAYVSGGLMLEKAGKTLTIITGAQFQPTDILAVWR